MYPKFQFDVVTNRNLYGGNMIAVSTDKGNLSFQSVDDVLKFVQTSAQENIELWISGKQPYPCISVCISGEYAATDTKKQEAIQNLAHNLDVF